MTTFLQCLGNSPELCNLIDSKLLMAMHDSVAKHTFICNNCLKEATQRCLGCKLTYYCSEQCQKANWHTHKKLCGSNECLAPVILLKQFSRCKKSSNFDDVRSRCAVGQMYVGGKEDGSEEEDGEKQSPADRTDPQSSRSSSSSSAEAEAAGTLQQVVLKTQQLDTSIALLESKTGIAPFDAATGRLVSCYELEPINDRLRVTLEHKLEKTPANAESFENENQLKEASDQITSIIGDASTKIVPTTWIGTIWQYLGSMMSGVLSYVVSAKDAIVKAFKWVIGSSSSSSSGAQSSGSSVLGSYSRTMYMWLRETATNILAYARKVAEWFTEQVEQTMDGIMKLVSNFIEVFTTQTPNLPAPVPAESTYPKSMREPGDLAPSFPAPPPPLTMRDDVAALFRPLVKIACVVGLIPTVGAQILVRAPQMLAKFAQSVVAHTEDFFRTLMGMVWFISSLIGRIPEFFTSLKSSVFDKYFDLPKVGEGEGIVWRVYLMLATVVKWISEIYHQRFLPAIDNYIMRKLSSFVFHITGADAELEPASDSSSSSSSSGATRGNTTVQDDDIYRMGERVMGSSLLSETDRTRLAEVLSLAKASRSLKMEVPETKTVSETKVSENAVEKTWSATISTADAISATIASLISDTTARRYDYLKTIRASLDAAYEGVLPPEQDSPQLREIFRGHNDAHGELLNRCQQMILKYDIENLELEEEEEKKKRKKKTEKEGEGEDATTSKERMPSLLSVPPLIPLSSVSSLNAASVKSPVGGWEEEERRREEERRGKEIMEDDERFLRLWRQERERASYWGGGGGESSGTTTTSQEGPGWMESVKIWLRRKFTPTVKHLPAIPKKRLQKLSSISIAVRLTEIVCFIVWCYYAAMLWGDFMTHLTEVVGIEQASYSKGHIDKTMSIGMYQYMHKETSVPVLIQKYNHYLTTSDQSLVSYRDAVKESLSVEQRDDLEFFRYHMENEETLHKAALASVLADAMTPDTEGELIPASPVEEPAAAAAAPTWWQKITFSKKEPDDPRSLETIKTRALGATTACSDDVKATILAALKLKPNQVPSLDNLNVIGFKVDGRTGKLMPDIKTEKRDENVHSIMLDDDDFLNAFLTPVKEKEFLRSVLSWNTGKSKFLPAVELSERTIKHMQRTQIIPLTNSVYASTKPLNTFSGDLTTLINEPKNANPLSVDRALAVGAAVQIVYGADPNEHGMAESNATKIATSAVGSNIEVHSEIKTIVTKAVEETLKNPWITEPGKFSETFTERTAGKTEEYYDAKYRENTFGTNLKTASVLNSLTSFRIFPSLFWSSPFKNAKGQMSWLSMESLTLLICSVVAYFVELVLLKLSVIEKGYGGLQWEQYGTLLLDHVAILGKKLYRHGTVLTGISLAFFGIVRILVMVTEGWSEMGTMTKILGILTAIMTTLLIYLLKGIALPKVSGVTDKLGTVYDSASSWASR